ncbi:hypothetical protein C9426_05645 [Serratia sp. S1B]|nr:hypothetical protein C9426_05645 [Serratia sp. S1B]
MITDDIPVANEAAGLLTTLVCPSHIVIYAPRVSLPCRLPATSLNLSIYPSSINMLDQACCVQKGA